MSRLFFKTRILWLLAIFAIFAAAPSWAEIETPDAAPMMEEEISPTSAAGAAVQKPSAPRKVPRIQGGPSGRYERLKRLIPPVDASYDEAFTAHVHVMECLDRDGARALNEDVPDVLRESMPQPFEHAACGRLKAYTLMEETLSIEVGEEKTINNTQTVPFVHSRLKVEPDGKGGFAFKRHKEQQELKAGTKLTISLPSAVGESVDVTLYVHEWRLMDQAEDMVLQSGGEVFFNPRPRVKERVMVADAPVSVGKPEIMGGKGYMRDVAPEKVPAVFPETGRLWAEITLKRVKAEAKAAEEARADTKN